MSEVVCFGTFDVVHAGHIHYLSQPSTEVVVYLSPDEPFTGKNVVHSFEDRKKVLKSLDFVDQVLKIPESLESFTEDVAGKEKIVLGPDYHSYAKHFEDEGLETVLVDSYKNISTERFVNKYD